MADLVFENLTFSYPSREKAAIDSLNLTLKGGTFTLLCGVSGCGKSTLLRHAKPSLSPHGKRIGRVTLGGEPLEKETAAIGFVGQQVRDAIVTDRVWHELAFGPEQMGMPPEIMRMKIAEIAGFFGMESWLHQDTATLSGGQCQLLNLAAVLVTDPEWLILDEPTAQLDPLAEEAFFQALERVHRELGIGVLVAEHRLERVLTLADRLLVMEDGRIVDDGTPQTVARQLLRRRSPLAAALPAAGRLAYAVGWQGDLPLTVAQGQRALEQAGLKALPEQPHPATEHPPCLGIDRAYFRYDREGADVLRGLSLSVGRGEILALVGSNGAGKSTLLSLLAGAQTPREGKLLWEGKRLSAARYREKAKIGWLVQETRYLFVCSGWWEDWSRTGATEEEKEAMASYLGLDLPRERHPFDLSGGERQRAALGKLLLTKPEALLLDEPTQGLDAAAKAVLARLLRELAKEGKAILLASHDLAFCAEVADSAAMLFDGQIASRGEIHAFFAANRTYTTAVNRIVRRWRPDAITEGEVLARERT